MLAFFHSNAGQLSPKQLANMLQLIACKLRNDKSRDPVESLHNDFDVNLDEVWESITCMSDERLTGLGEAHSAAHVVGLIAEAQELTAVKSLIC